jgi:hypothetical protein
MLYAVASTFKAQPTCALAPPLQTPRGQRLRLRRTACVSQRASATEWIWCLSCCGLPHLCVCGRLVGIVHKESLNAVCWLVEPAVPKYAPRLPYHWHAAALPARHRTAPMQPTWNSTLGYSSPWPHLGGRQRLRPTGVGSNPVAVCARSVCSGATAWAPACCERGRGAGADACLADLCGCVVALAPRGGRLGAACRAAVVRWRWFALGAGRLAASDGRDGSTCTCVTPQLAHHPFGGGSWWVGGQ